MASDKSFPLCESNGDDDRPGRKDRSAANLSVELFDKLCVRSVRVAADDDVLVPVPLRSDESADNGLDERRCDTILVDDRVPEFRREVANGNVVRALPYRN